MKFSNIQIRGMHFLKKEPRTETAASVYAGYADGSVRRLNIQGQRLWTIDDFTGAITKVIETELRQTFISSLDGTVKRYNSSGDLIWSYDDHTGAINDMAFDVSETEIITASSDGSVRKLTEDKTLVWSYTGHTGAVNGVAVSVSGNVHTAGNDGTVKKLELDGQDSIWSVSEHTGTILGIAVDIDGDVYSFGTDNLIIKYSGIDGTVLWTFSGNVTDVIDVVIDQYGNVFSVSFDGILRNINSSGQEVDAFDLEDEPTGIDRDVSGYLYVSLRNNGVVRLTNIGSEMWVYNNHASDVTTVSCTQAIVMYPPIITSAEFYPLLAPEDLEAE